jgi:hypothetical protein
MPQGQAVLNYAKYRRISWENPRWMAEIAADRNILLIVKKFATFEAVHTKKK